MSLNAPLKHTVICKRCERSGNLVPLFQGVAITGHQPFTEAKVVRVVNA